MSSILVVGFTGCFGCCGSLLLLLLLLFWLSLVLKSFAVDWLPIVSHHICFLTYDGAMSESPGL